MGMRMVCESEEGWSDEDHPHPPTTEAECHFCAGNVTLAVDTMTSQAVAEYAVWYARKVKGPAAKVAAALLEEFPWLREPLEAAGTLDEAWAAAEAAAHAIAPGIGAISVSRWAWNVPEPFVASWRNERAFGPTPAAALLALADALRAVPA